MCGTVTPAYMPSDPEQIDRIAFRMRAITPGLIAILRDPIDRAVSHFRSGVRHGGVGPDHKTFDKGVSERSSGAAKPG